ncbi:MAG: pseudouridine synthase [Pseudomonadota bacterium]|nr:pseudouridine synthase [Pseudomonadota bacterium]MEC7106799.1 pseudouridine synthase [Pseudomonadota bacterium]MEC7137594.1 pseudouridine synthase [Pseudomonadota bacterium]MEC7380324.1 pseudouridine synthase [Pseudomonadota bacterium]MEC7420058.1 pseudouridine synthase [Pseudomonadota bacterium]|tara:strand:+ start:1282 stop:2142 length:861 start_codon:yes stop_codon:yes gene_type:complete
MTTRQPKPDQGDGEKLQKVLAAQGFGSRRQMENWITEGRVLVNGQTAHLGQRVVKQDQLVVDGQTVSERRSNAPQILLLNKAGGTVCSRRDPEKRPTIFDQLPRLREGRWITVGRLDMATTGLLLLTNDGELAHKLMHPSTGMDREYAVRINRKLDDEALGQLTEGVVVEGEAMRFSDIRYYNGSENNFWYHVALMEGKNREVRRLFDAVGATVSRLKRVRYGPVILPSWLTVGHWASMQLDDLRRLYKLMRMPIQGSDLQAAQRLKRSKVAKTSCLVPYPDLPER